MTRRILRTCQNLLRSVYFTAEISSQSVVLSIKSVIKHVGSLGIPLASEPLDLRDAAGV